MDEIIRVRQPEEPTEDKKEFECRVKELEGIKFENLQEYIQAIDRLYNR